MRNVLALVLLVGCATPTQADLDEPVPARILGDPGKMLTLRLSLMRQIVGQSRDIPEDRYRELRPRLAERLRVAGLAAVEVDYILRSVDDDRARGPSPRAVATDQLRARP
jgi:hypothetical protein